MAQVSTRKIISNSCLMSDIERQLVRPFANNTSSVGRPETCLNDRHFARQLTNFPGARLNHDEEESIVHRQLPFLAVMYRIGGKS
jgi:hypothetical protein